MIAQPPIHHHHRAHPYAAKHCIKHFTRRMAERGIHWTYRGTVKVSPHRARKVKWYIRCQWDIRNRRRLNHDRRHAIHAWHKRRALPPWSYAYASYYYDPPSSTNCCGLNVYYGVAVCGYPSGICVPQGTHIEFAYGDRRVEAIADDHGPYVSGRQFDLNQNTRAAIGFPGLGTVRYRILKPGQHDTR